MIISFSVLQSSFLNIFLKLLQIQTFMVNVYIEKILFLSLISCVKCQFIWQNTLLENSLYQFSAISCLIPQRSILSIERSHMIHSACAYLFYHDRRIIYGDIKVC